MKVGNCIALAVIATILVTSTSAVQAQSNPIVMKLATPTINDSQHEWLKRFAMEIEEKSGGRIKTEIYPASQLGTIPRMIENTQLGSIQIFISPPEFFVGIDQRFQLLSAAGLVENEQHAIRTVSDTEFAKAFLGIGSNKGLIGVSLFGPVPESFATRTPFRTLAYLKGKKIRVLASPFQVDQITRLGGTGVPMSLSDVLPALQQGTIDGVLAGLSIFTPFRYWDVTKYVNETNHAFAFSLAVASKRWFDTLPNDLKSIILSTGTEVGAEISAWQTDWFDRQRKIWIENGGELNTLSADDKAEMMAKISTIGDDIVKTKLELQSLWGLLRAAAKRSL